MAVCVSILFHNLDSLIHYILKTHTYRVLGVDTLNDIQRGIYSFSLTSGAGARLSILNCMWTLRVLGRGHLHVSLLSVFMLGVHVCMRMGMHACDCVCLFVYVSGQVSDSPLGGCSVVCWLTPRSCLAGPQPPGSVRSLLGAKVFLGFSSLDDCGPGLLHACFRSWEAGLWLPTPTMRHYMEKPYEHKHAHTHTPTQRCSHRCTHRYPQTHTILECYCL